MVALNGQELAGWTFDYNNVLAWADQAGSYSAWLQALVLPGGPRLRRQGHHRRRVRGCGARVHRV